MKSEIIKFKCELIKGEIQNTSIINDLNSIRRFLLNKKLFGLSEDGISYGNVSMLCSELWQNYSNKPKFIITTSGNSGIETFTISDYCAVVDYDFEQNFVKCIGRRNASSESLTHASVYNAVDKAKIVVHFHNRQIWEALIYRVPTTERRYEYGTVKLALDLIQIIKSSQWKNDVIILGGHPDGVILWGETIMDLLKRIDGLINNAK